MTTRAPVPKTPLKSLGPYGTSHITELFEGWYPIDGLDISPHARQWLKWLKQTEKERETNPVPPTISPDMFKDAFESTDEMTISSPSSLYYTLWKEVAEQNDMCVYYAAMMSPPFQYAFANSRWITKIDVSLKNNSWSKKDTPNEDHRNSQGRFQLSTQDTIHSTTHVESQSKRYNFQSMGRESKPIGTRLRIG